MILVTGAGGFIGQHLLRDLCLSGIPSIALRRGTRDLGPLVESRQWEDEEIRKIFSEHHVEAIIHAATNYGHGDDALSLVADNLERPSRLLEIALEFKVKTFINLDSFFSLRGLTYSHLQPYSETKRLFRERLCMTAGPIRVENLVLNHVYGPGDRKPKFVPWIIEELLRNAPEIPLSLGEQARDFVYVDDVIQSILQILKQPATTTPFRELWIGSGHSYSLRYFIEMARDTIESQTQKKVSSRLLFGALPYRDGEFSILADLRQRGRSMSLSKGLTATVRSHLNETRS